MKIEPDKLKDLFDSLMKEGDSPTIEEISANAKIALIKDFLDPSIAQEDKDAVGFVMGILMIVTPVLSSIAKIGPALERLAAAQEKAAEAHETIASVQISESLPPIFVSFGDEDQQDLAEGEPEGQASDNDRRSGTRITMSPEEWQRAELFKGMMAIQLDHTTLRKNTVGLNPFLWSNHVLRLEDYENANSIDITYGGRTVRVKNRGGKLDEIPLDAVILANHGFDPPAKPFSRPMQKAKDPNAPTDGWGTAPISPSERRETYELDITTHPMRGGHVGNWREHITPMQFDLAKNVAITHNGSRKVLKQDGAVTD